MMKKKQMQEKKITFLFAVQKVCVCVCVHRQRDRRCTGEEARERSLSACGGQGMRGRI